MRFGWHLFRSLRTKAWTWSGKQTFADIGLTGSHYLTLRPNLDYAEQIAQSKPTQVAVGIVKGYSFPIYNTDNEELFFRETVPGRWNGSSDIIFHLRVALGNAEDVGDSFQFRFAWEHIIEGEPIPVTSNDVDVEQAVLTGRAAQYDEYELTFIINYDIDGAGSEIKAHELLAGRLYRIDATNPDVANEVIVVDWHTHYQIDKVAAIA